MATLTVGSVVDRVARLLYDQTNIKWSRSELLEHINAAQRVVALASPTTGSTISVVQLVAGSRQVIPVNGWLLLDVIRNMGVNGITPGRAVRVISRRLLESYNPNWQSTTPSSITQSYWFDPQDQTGYFVYPPSDGTGHLEINYSSAPDTLTSESQTMTLPDVADAAVINFVCFRALSKVSEFGNPQLAAGYLEAFNQLLGAKYTAEQANNPNLGLMPFSPDARGGTS